jgi:SAM-dependent methyltransferase
MALGDFALMTNEERAEWYRTHKCAPTTDASAAGLARVQWLTQEHAKRPFRSFLDVGCHDGFVTRWLVDTIDFGTLIGIDPCVDAIKYADTSIQNRSSPEKAVYFACGYSDFKPETQFDGVCFFEALEHFPYDECVRILEYLHARIKLGGRAYICTPHIDGRWGKSNPDPAHINLFDPQKLEQLFAGPSNIRNDTPNIFCDKNNDYIYASWEKS